MFVGFIVIIVVLLIIVGVIATGSKDTSGILQTKVMQVNSEIVALTEKASLYKLKTDNFSYDGFSPQDIVDDGVLADKGNLITDIADVDTGTDSHPELSMLNIDSANTYLDTNYKLIRSQAIDGVFLSVGVDPNDNKKYNLQVLCLSSLDSKIKNLLEKIVNKQLKRVFNYSNDNSSDGAFILQFD